MNPGNNALALNERKLSIWTYFIYIDVSAGYSIFINIKSIKW